MLVWLGAGWFCLLWQWAPEALVSSHCLLLFSSSQLYLGFPPRNSFINRVCVLQLPPWSATVTTPASCPVVVMGR